MAMSPNYITDVFEHYVNTQLPGASWRTHRDVNTRALTMTTNTGGGNHTITIPDMSLAIAGGGEIERLRSELDKLKAQIKSGTTATQKAILEQQRQMRMWVEHTEARRKADELVRIKREQNQRTATAHEALNKQPKTWNDIADALSKPSNLGFSTLNSVLSAYVGEKPKPAPTTPLQAARPGARKWKYASL